MPKHVRIGAHLSIEDLAYRYRKATGSIERSHFQIILLLAQKKHVRKVTESTSYYASWIRMLSRRSRLDGSRSLANQRQHTHGAFVHHSFLPRSHAKQTGMLFTSDTSEVEI